MAKPTALIVNPLAGRGRVGKELPRLLETMRDAGVPFEVMQTAHPGHASELALRAAEGGADLVVAVGGDGTVNEVVNGLIDADEPVGTAALGVVAAGSGCDFARTFDLPGHIGSDGILGGSRTPIDIGKVVCDGPRGLVTRYFANVAQAGIGAATVEAAERLPRRLGRSRYVIAFWPVLARFEPAAVTVDTGEDRRKARAHNVVVANARFFGGGMHISPNSDPADGVLDVQTSIGPKRQAFTLIPRIFRGKHLPNPRILEQSGSTIRVDSERPFPVEVDGETAGTTPATFSILPGVIDLATA